MPRIVATSPATMSGGLSRLDSARQPMPTAISAAAAIAEWRAGLGLGGRPESASMTGRRATVRPGHQAAAVAPRTARSDGQRDQPPRKAEPVDAMVDRRLERRRERDPEREARDRPDECGDRPDDGAVRQQHEAEVLLRRADGGEHAELAEPSLGDDGEAGGGNQRRQEEEDGGHGEHRQRLRRTADVASADHGAREGRAGSGRPGIDRRSRATSALASTSTVTRSGRARTRARRERTRRSACAGSRRCRRRVRRRPSSARVDPISSRRASATPSVTATSPRPDRVAAPAEREQLAAVGAAAGPATGNPPSRRCRGRARSGGR